MKVMKFNFVSAPDYPSHQQFAECKALIGAIVIGLGGTVLAAEAPVQPGGKVIVEPRQEASAKPSIQPAAPQVPGHPAGVIRPEPQPPQPVNQPRLGGIAPIEPPRPAPSPSPITQ